MSDAVKNDGTQRVQYTPDPNGTVGDNGDVKKTGGAQPQTGAGDIDVDVAGVRVSYQDDKVVVAVALDIHELDDNPGPMSDEQHASLGLVLTLDPQPGLDLIALVGQVTDQLRHSLNDIKSSVHATEMEVRQDQLDSSYKAADDEKKLGDSALGFSIASGVTQMAFGAWSAKASWNVGTNPAEQMQAQARSTAINSMGGGISTGLSGGEKFYESGIRSDQQRKQADAQFEGSLLSDLSPQSIQEAVKEVQQYFAHADDKVSQGMSILVGNLNVR